MAEQLIRNQQVVSSSLTVGSFVIKGLHDLMNHKKCLGLPMGYLAISISRYAQIKTFFFHEKEKVIINGKLLIPGEWC